jgi:hypothetical protein
LKEWSTASTTKIPLKSLNTLSNLCFLTASPVEG